jgi:hypothetical protein
MADSRPKSSVFHNRQQRGKTSRTGMRAIQLAGSAVEGSLGLDLLFLFLSSFPATARVVFEPIAPPGNGNGLGVVQKTIQNRASGGHVAQKFAPLLQWPVAGHDGGPVFIAAHDPLKKMLAGVLGQLLQAKIVNYFPLALRDDCVMISYRYQSTINESPYEY